MAGIYYSDAAVWLRGVGLTVVECDGWKTRARSSGGFAKAPLGVQWHHTASKTTPANDTAWQCTGSDDAPIGNGTIMRDGAVWMVAAGAANTAGKGGPLTLSRGTVPMDSGNTTTWAWEVANSGVGEPWPQVQIDAYFAASNEMNRRFGNQPTDVFSHALGTGDGWTSRKIDPATAAAVQGPWKPRSVNSSGTWSLADIRAECSRRAGSSPTPPTPPTGTTYVVVAGDSWYGIARKLACTVDALYAANPPASAATVIYPGDVLNVPGATAPTPGPDPPGAAMTTPPPTMQRPNTYPNVQWLQSVLAAIPKLAADGGGWIYNPAWVGHDRIGNGPEGAQLYGDQTHNAVAYWQRANGLTADGVYGTTTANAMAAARGK